MYGRYFQQIRAIDLSFRRIWYSVGWNYKWQTCSDRNVLLYCEPLRTETLAQRLNRAFMLDFKGLSLDYPKLELEKIQNLSLEDLNNYIKTHTELNNLTFFI